MGKRDRKEKIQIINIRNKTEVTLLTLKVAKKRLRENYKLYTYIWQLGWNGPITWKILNTTIHSKGNQFSTFTTTKEIEFVTEKLKRKKKSPGLNGFIKELYQTFKELTPAVHSIFQKTEEEGILSSLFYKTYILLEVLTSTIEQKQNKTEQNPPNQKNRETKKR